MTVRVAALLLLLAGVGTAIEASAAFSINTHGYFFESGNVPMKPLPASISNRSRTGAAIQTKIQAALDLITNRPCNCFATSKLDPVYAAGKAMDGNPNTRWKAMSGYPQWLVVDLKVLTTISQIELKFDENKNTVWKYKVQASNVNVGDDDFPAMWWDLWDASVNGEKMPSNGNSILHEAGSVPSAYRYVRVRVEGASDGRAAVLQLFRAFGTRDVQPRGIVPPPVKPAGQENQLIGMQLCPLWATEVQWAPMLPYPDRRTMLGMYNEAYDVVVDWYTKQMVDFGVDFVMPCWYRMARNAGQFAVFSSYEHYIRALADTAEHRDAIKWAFQFIAHQTGDVTGLDDFKTNLVPYWISYFTRSNYMKVDGKPLFAIFLPERLAAQVGGWAKLAEGLANFRAQAASAGFPGVIFMAYHSASTIATNSDLQAAGFDIIYAYHLPTFTDVKPPSQNPTDQQIVDAHVQVWTNWEQNSVVPSAVSASVGWDSRPWGSMFSSQQWKLAREGWRLLLAKAKEHMARRSGLAGRLLMLDNWNEYAEGHAMAPNLVDGYMYMEELARAFYPCANPAKLVPDTSKIPQLA